MSKTSKRRPCLISREEETLRWNLALGAITMDVFTMKMNDLDARANPRGVCVQCKDGLKVGPNYKITCRIINELHGQWHTCAKFREDL